MRFLWRLLWTPGLASGHHSPSSTTFPVLRLIRLIRIAGKILFPLTHFNGRVCFRICRARATPAFSARLIDLLESVFVHRVHDVAAIPPGVEPRPTKRRATLSRCARQQWRPNAEPPPRAPSSFHRDCAGCAMQPARDSMAREYVTVNAIELALGNFNHFPTCEKKF